MEQTAPRDFLSDNYPNEEEEDEEEDENKLTAGDFIRYLNSLSSEGRRRAKSKIFRFGLSRK